MPTIRDTVLGRCGFLGIAVWAMWFALDVVRIGDQVTSKQWQYLMDLPGGKWLWCCLFGLSGLAVAIGTPLAKYKLTALGLFCVGSSCLSITAFYALAPQFVPGLLTLGYNPWVFVAIAGYIGAAAAWRPMRWY